MLKRLSVENFAIVEHADLEFAPGLSALTGQTGAGKSLLIDALGCILGQRASSDFLRRGCSEGCVEAFFVIEDSRLAERIGSILAGPIQDGELLLRRRLTASGRFPAEVNGRSVPVSLLKSIGELLVDIHGQNEHQRLISPVVQLEELDLYAGLAAKRNRFSAAWQRLREGWERLSRLRDERDLLERERDLLDHRINELSSARIRSADELDELSDRRDEAAHHQRIAETVSEVAQRLYTSEGSLASVVERLLGKLSRLEGITGDIDRWAEMLRQAKVLLAEVGLEADRHLGRIDGSPGRLEEIENRMAALRGLCRKYGPGLADCMETLEEDKARLADLESMDVRVEDAEKAAREALERTAAAGRRLSTGRAEAAAKLARAVEDHLGELGMKEARFNVELAPVGGLEKPSDVDNIGQSGLDFVEFMLMPNPGEGWSSLSRVASGGEIARTMLALKSVLAGVDRVPVLVFDEIDTDIGSRMGETVGRKLAALSKHHQVILVTHLPQIAAFADRQFTVTKARKGSRTITEVRPLTRQGRLKELAEMLRGPEKSAEALDQAEKMLSDATSRKQCQSHVAPTHGERET